jgi:hypothetical protein
MQIKSISAPAKATREVQHNNEEDAMHNNLGRNNKKI